MRFFLFLVLFVCVAGPASAATFIVFGGSTNLPVDPWWDANWENRRKITFDNTASGGNLTDFPVLVSLSSPANIDYAKTMDQGEDLRFIDADGTTVLKYEIEQWDEAGTSTVWVKVPQIDSGVNTDYIWMYYNNPGETDTQDPTNVWDLNYKAVWHLDETSGSTISDATSNGNDGTKRSATEPNPVTTGKIGGAQAFDGSNDDVTNSSLTTPASLTFEAWISPDATPGFNTVIEFGDDTPWFGVQSDRKLAFFRGGSGIASAAKVTLSTFNHVVVTHDGNTLRMWINGVEDLPAGTLNNSDTATGFGVGYNGTDTPFDGIIDEVRISSIARSADWIEAQYKSMNLTFNTFGGEETAPPLPVELVAFDALVNGTEVHLAWKTASETNNAGFEVQHTPGLATVQATALPWEILGFLEGYGTTERPRSYTYHVTGLAPGRHVFRLKQIDFDGTFEYSPKIEVVVEMVERFLVEPVYPNPFNPQAQFRFAVKRSQQVEVALYDMLGRRVKLLYAGSPPLGQMHTVRIDGRGLPSGLYVVRLVGEQFVETQTVTLLK